MDYMTPKLTRSRSLGPSGQHWNKIMTGRARHVIDFSTGAIEYICRELGDIFKEPIATFEARFEQIFDIDSHLPHKDLYSPQAVAQSHTYNVLVGNLFFAMFFSTHFGLKVNDKKFIKGLSRATYSPELKKQLVDNFILLKVNKARKDKELNKIITNITFQYSKLNKKKEKTLYYK